ncbi:MAG: Gfo/Idh/MocA family oxidoreductase [Verrucomicrobia bacterium]|nr:Gfo/Idh/MocA family oxidoreductase [Verrucomicrobiota bacterium]
MRSTSSPARSRREFLKNTGQFATVSALAGVALPHVHAAGSDLIQVALIGCGGRGTGAAGQALSTTSGPIKLVAMADVFPAKLKASLERLTKQYPQRAAQIEVPPERQFIGFDAGEKAMECLKPGDVAILATPPAFRWPMFQRAIAKGLHVFMEKPVSVDGPTTRRMIALGEQATAKNLKVGVGLMVRHCEGRKELYQRIRDGQIGEIVSMRAYRMGSGGGTAPPKPADVSELMYQISKFHAFLWLSGGVFSDYYIHQIDECSWMKDAWPVEAMAIGGRHYRGDSLDQNFDTYSVQYTYPDGTKLFYEGRNMPGVHNEFASYAHGSKGSAVITTRSHHPGQVRIYRGHNVPRILTPKDKIDLADPNLQWAFPQPEKNPQQLEWDNLIAAIRQDRPYNEVRRGAEASLVACMGRMAAHTGQIITFDQMLNHDHEFAPDVDKLTMDSPSPLPLGADGRYPVPRPGIETKREY